MNVDYLNCNISGDEEPEFIKQCRIDEIKNRPIVFVYEREKEIDLEIENIVKRWLKYNPQFERVKSKSEASHLLLFQRSNLTQFNIIPKGKFDSSIINIPHWFLQTKIYIKDINSYH